MLSATSYIVILFWTLCLLALAGFNGVWAVRFYKRITKGKDPMAPPFFVLQIAYTNMFTCFAFIRAMPLFGVEPNKDVILLGWGSLSTLGVIAGFVALQYQIQAQKKDSRGRNVN